MTSERVRILRVAGDLIATGLDKRPIRISKGKLIVEVKPPDIFRLTNDTKQFSLLKDDVDALIDTGEKDTRYLSELQ